ncbi:MAG: phosphoribosylglycinamide formyltransferase [Gemmatimonadaceae bacterium]|nr:phosphoribosylglycinamide formyltransferase [Gemmatimonadaceae bacterium]
MARIAVLASGGGSNLQALIDRIAALGAGAPAEIALVISDRRAAGALERATRAGIPTAYVPASAPEGALEAALVDAQIDLIALAGYLRYIPVPVVQRFHARMVNIHPSLLPAFGGAGMHGMHVHRAVLAAGATESGATVHFVDEVFDRGPIAAQGRVPVLAGDDADTLAARVLTLEHRLFPWAVLALARGALALTDDGRVQGARLDLTLDSPLSD